LNPKRHRAKKRLGQNFLYDPAIARKIVDATSLKPGDVAVELGAGRGILTRELAARGTRLVALELDSDLASELKNEFEGIAASETDFLTRAEILNEDFTRISLSGLLAARALNRCTLLGNIPYNLTRDVLFSFLVRENEVIDAAYIMLQKEVGDRIVSPPGSRVYGITSVVLQSLYDVKIVMRVAPGSFSPRPKVASSVLEFKPLETPMMDRAELDPFVTLVKNVFQQRRKTIQNTLKSFYSLSQAELERIESESGIDLGLRPESLGKEEFLRLMRMLTG
jgi:16S rRNA (adenine1518-N6/adenine1519-N6)-dimethyltransferase